MSRLFVGANKLAPPQLPLFCSHSVIKQGFQKTKKSLKFADRFKQKVYLMLTCNVGFSRNVLEMKIYCEGQVICAAYRKLFPDK